MPMPNKSFSRSSRPLTDIRVRSTTLSRGSRAARTATPIRRITGSYGTCLPSGSSVTNGSRIWSASFLTARRKDYVRHGRSREGYAHNVDALFDTLPPVWIVLDRYVRFLYHIGERSMPAAFVRIGNALRRGIPADMLRESNTVYMLEVHLQSQIYSRPLELKRDPALRVAILFVLDVLVESGSSAAFRMRDDFVTPAA